MTATSARGCAAVGRTAQIYPVLLSQWQFIMCPHNGWINSLNGESKGTEWVQLLKLKEPNSTHLKSTYNTVLVKGSCTQNHSLTIFDPPTEP